jgi:hypothetical protein
LINTLFLSYLIYFILFSVDDFILFKKGYDNVRDINKDNWLWVNSYKLPFAKFKNELIGVLCTELAEGKELNDACQTWNKRVDPANYMKAIAPITKKQIEEAKKFVEENVKSAGGKIEGILRCSLQWNDDGTKGIVDFDLHCKESRGSEIYYSQKKSYQTNGWLDVDMIRPSKIGIENITWQQKLPNMEYQFL